jgi:hypothetical protein
MLRLEEQERRLREARLLVSRPEEVFKELRSYGAQAKANLYGSDEELEKSLLERGDPLIDLGLACYGSDKGMVGALYKKALITPNTPADARYLKGLRIACLSNQVGRCGFTGPREIIGEDETRRVLGEADWDEAEALICNPEIGCELLQALYERKGPFSTIPEKRWLILVHKSANNTRLVDCRAARARRWAMNISENAGSCWITQTIAAFSRRTMTEDQPGRSNIRFATLISDDRSHANERAESHSRAAVLEIEPTLARNGSPVRKFCPTTTI